MDKFWSWFSVVLPALFLTGAGVALSTIATVNCWVFAAVVIAALVIQLTIKKFMSQAVYKSVELLELIGSIILMLEADILSPKLAFAAKVGLFVLVLFFIFAVLIPEVKYTLNGYKSK